MEEKKERQDGKERSNCESESDGEDKRRKNESKTRVYVYMHAYLWAYIHTSKRESQGASSCPQSVRTEHPWKPALEFKTLIPPSRQILFVSDFYSPFFSFT